MTTALPAMIGEHQSATGVTSDELVSCPRCGALTYRDSAHTCDGAARARRERQLRDDVFRAALDLGSAYECASGAAPGSEDHASYLHHCEQAALAVRALREVAPHA